MSLATQTPNEIDAQLYGIEIEVGNLAAKRAAREKTVANPPRYLSESNLRSLENEIAKLSERIDTLVEQAKPLDAEFERRGGWTRAFLVVNNGSGHVHRTMDCSTCFNTTQFHWMTEYSAKNEQEIVDAAGERACTVCYKSAPVQLRLDRPTQMFTYDELAAQEARREREVKRQAAASAAIIDPETGKVLFKTARGATNQISQLADSIVGYSWNGTPHPSQDEWVAEIRKILAALGSEDVEADLKAAIDAKLAKYPAQARKGNKEAHARGWDTWDNYSPMPEVHPGVSL